jgi:hypothetical protein
MQNTTENAVIPQIPEPQRDGEPQPRNLAREPDGQHAANGVSPVEHVEHNNA